MARATDYRIKATFEGKVIATTTIPAGEVDYKLIAERLTVAIERARNFNSAAKLPQTLADVELVLVPFVASSRGDIFGKPRPIENRMEV